MLTIVPSKYLITDWILLVSTRDMAKAFRQVPVLPSHMRFSVIAVYHPYNKRWVFFLLVGAAFGIKAAVLLFASGIHGGLERN